MSVKNYQKSRRDIYEKYLPCSFVCELCLRFTGNKKSPLNSALHSNAVSIVLPLKNSITHKHFNYLTVLIIVAQYNLPIFGI